MSANMIVFHSPFLLWTELEDYNSMSPLLCYCCGGCTIYLYRCRERERERANKKTVMLGEYCGRASCRSKPPEPLRIIQHSNLNTTPHGLFKPM